MNQSLMVREYKRQKCEIHVVDVLSTVTIIERDHLFFFITYHDALDIADSN